MKALRNKKGFTLVELIVTIAILSVLVLLAVPRFGGHIQDAQLAKGIANAKSIENASRLYYMDNDDWPRLTDDPYTDEELKDFSERIYDITGKEVDIDPDGNYYNIDYNKLDKYVKISDDKRNYILQNPVGKIFYMENLSEEGLSRVSYENESGPELPNEEIVYEFSNAGLLGRLGPTQSQLDNAYSGTSLAGKVNSDNGTQVWTVPKSGTYKIEAYGAQGGSSNGSYKGGKGAILSGEFHITKGSKLRIIVGQTVVNNYFAPGGGASGAWVSNSDTPMIIAGGGGGANDITNSKSGGNANLTTDGGSSDGAGGKNGNGGQANFQTGGGAGWLTDGQSRTSDGGTALKNGAQGGVGQSTSYDGGFGGGGGGFGGGGGGGGYSGGGSGDYRKTRSYGGGGGSYNSGANKENSVGNTGHGKVIITYIGE